VGVLSPRGRLDRLSRHLGIGVGPSQTCPHCDGTGWDDSEARIAVLIPQRINAIIEQFTGHPGNEPEPDPATLPPATPCALCHATGITRVAAVQAHEAQCAGNRERLARMMDATWSHLG
jgi:hypothetical protein